MADPAAASQQLSTGRCGPPGRRVEGYRAIMRQSPKPAGSNLSQNPVPVFRLFEQGRPSHLNQANTLASQNQAVTRFANGGSLGTVALLARRFQPAFGQGTIGAQLERLLIR